MTKDSQCIKRYGIKHVEKVLRVEQHILRYWEKRFDLEIERMNGRRYYTQADIDALERIKKILYVDGVRLDKAAKHFRKRHKKVSIEDLENPYRIVSFYYNWSIYFGGS